MILVAQCHMTAVTYSVCISGWVHMCVYVLRVSVHVHVCSVGVLHTCVEVVDLVCSVWVCSALLYVCACA